VIPVKKKKKLDYLNKPPPAIIKQNRRIAPDDFNTKLSFFNKKDYIHLKNPFLRSKKEVNHIYTVKNSYDF
jgi:hypothetical protein